MLRLGKSGIGEIARAQREALGRFDPKANVEILSRLR